MIDARVFQIHHAIETRHGTLIVAHSSLSPPGADSHDDSALDDRSSSSSSDDSVDDELGGFGCGVSSSSRTTKTAAGGSSSASQTGGDDGGSLSRPTYDWITEIRIGGGDSASVVRVYGGLSGDLLGWPNHLALVPATDRYAGGGGDDDFRVVVIEKTRCRVLLLRSTPVGRCSRPNCGWNGGGASGAAAACCKNGLTPAHESGGLALERVLVGLDNDGSLQGHPVRMAFSSDKKWLIVGLEDGAVNAYC